MTERIEYSEKIVKVDLDQIVHHLAEAGVATNEIRILAPILLNLLMGHIDLLKNQQQSTSDFSMALLKFYERSKNNGYMLRKRAGSCMFDSNQAMKLAQAESQDEFKLLLELRKGVDSAQLRQLEEFSTRMVEQIHAIMGAQSASGAEVLQNLIKDADIIEGKAEKVEREKVGGE